MKVRARILSILLCISLIFGSVNPAVLAAEQQPVNGVEVSSETTAEAEILPETGTVSDAETEGAEEAAEEDIAGEELRAEYVSVL